MSYSGLARISAVHSERHVFDNVSMPCHVESSATASIALRDVMEGKLVPDSNLFSAHSRMRLDGQTVKVRSQQKKLESISGLLGGPQRRLICLFWVAAQELKFTYHNPETILFTICQYFVI